MSTPSTWITPGSWTAIAGSKLWVLADTSDRPQAVRDLWSVVSPGDASADQVLGLLLADGLSDLRGFAIVSAADEGVRLIVRHPAVVNLEASDGAEEIAPAAGITWVDTSRLRPRQIVVTAPDRTRADNELPLTLGASSADALLIDFADQAAPVRPATPATDDPGVTEAPMSTPPEGVAPQSATEAADDAHQAVDAAPPEAPEPDSITERIANPYLGLLTSSTNDRDALLARLNEPVEAEQSTAPEPLVSGATAQWPTDIEGPAEDDEESAPDLEHPSSGRLIDGVPGMGPVPGAAPPLPPMDATALDAVRTTPAGPEDVNSKTMTRHRLQEVLGSAGSVGPTVMAVRCRLGHLSNPLLSKCRVCDEIVPDQTPVQVPRPSLGVLRMPNGDTVPLEKSIVVGRSPRATAGADEHLVTVTTSGEISRMHARISLDNWNVVLRDLNTTNGTFLTLPGQPTVQLRGGEDYLVEPGSEIDLADALTLRYEAR